MTLCGFDFATALNRTSIKITHNKHIFTLYTLSPSVVLSVSIVSKYVPLLPTSHIIPVTGWKLCRTPCVNPVTGPTTKQYFRPAHQRLYSSSLDKPAPTAALRVLLLVLSSFWNLRYATSQPSSSWTFVGYQLLRDRSIRDLSFH